MSSSTLAISNSIAQSIGLQRENESLLYNKEVRFAVDPEVSCTLLRGDNLAALELLLNNSSPEIDFCYIDPPYNTGSKFIYNDKITSSNKGIWKKHSAWMSFMLPRLVAAQSLLKDDGIIAVSIDDYEYTHLKILMDNIFGEQNHLGTIIVNRSVNGKGSRAHIATNHEYVVIFGKSKDSKMLGFPVAPKENEYDREDAFGKFKIDGLFRKKGAHSAREDRPNMFYPLYCHPDGRVFTENKIAGLKEVYPLDKNGVEKRWLWGKEKASADSWKLYASKNGVVYVKNYLTDEKRIKARSIWSDNKYLTDKATNEIVDIYSQKVFETPKPLGLIEDLITCCMPSNGYILDFFAGTGTTAHAASNLNTKDNGNRKVILAEQNTRIDQQHIATTLGFDEIGEITEFRLRHIAEINLNFNFDVFNLDESML